MLRQLPAPNSSERLAPARPRAASATPTTTASPAAETLGATSSTASSRHSSGRLARQPPPRTWRHPIRRVRARLRRSNPDPISSPTTQPDLMQCSAGPDLKTARGVLHPVLARDQAALGASRSGGRAARIAHSDRAERNGSRRRLRSSASVRQGPVRCRRHGRCRLSSRSPRGPLSRRHDATSGLQFSGRRFPRVGGLPTCLPAP